ncbi:methyltransferase domain-containing protein [Nocardioides sp. GY 10127]|uniref:class I SAM-dependent methyltransferase n=1 Tax=Nocardioides sp. GY 10127 TaxID=2569762 RepID=UPI0010A851D5|nr:methyltransferase domain-containing protein [Nocardioides sp. GY 10127]TIC79103.1 methyltransferase domain-containing protein [Nocardioides sp. GY 10127]
MTAPTPATYTHGYAESVQRSYRVRTAENSAAYLLPHLRAGQDLLDVGSGPGTITAGLAARVAPGPGTGSVTALEVAEEALAQTRAGLEAAGLGASGVEASLLVGDVHALDLPDDSFDVVHAHQVLQHVADPVAALREMIRVCRPGGVVAVRDADYASFAWFPASPGLEEWARLYQQAARANGGEPDAGRRLLSWARAAGATDVVATSSTWCYADDAARELWGGSWAERITGSAIAVQLEASGTPRADLEAVAQAWRDWAASPDGWFNIVHGEVLIRV